MTRLVEIDPIAVTLPYLVAHAGVAEVLGGGDVAAHVTADNEPPYPHIRLSDPPGSDRDLNHLLAPVVQIEVHGDMDGTHGKPLLRRILYTVLGALAELPTRPVTDPTAPVVTAVTSSGGGGWVPEPTGQPRYLATVQIHMHPGRELPAGL